LSLYHRLGSARFFPFANWACLNFVFPRFHALLAKLILANIVANNRVVDRLQANFAQIEIIGVILDKAGIC
jgi:Na+-transporting methylmalonyl-CoA/oxaloacetate decarboxylase beta subunit